MGDMLTNALSALNSYQRALSTTSHNIANAQTEGYSRQRVDFSTRVPQNFGFGTIGSGVQVDAVRRTLDQFAVQQLRSSTADFNQLDTFNQLASRVDNVLADPATGVSAALSQFFNSLQDVIDDPASLPARQVFLSEAETLVSRFNGLDSQLDDLETEVNSRVRASVDEINGLTSRIADLNRSITNALGQTGGAPPNDLLDKRDQALVELNKLVKVSVVDQGGGSLSVFIASGDALVLDERAFNLAATQSAFDPTRLELSLNTASGPAEVTDLVNGGSLGGALQFREEVLDPVRSQLGRVGAALGLTFNEQHQAGMDLNGNLGGDFFTVPEPQTLTSRFNTGTASVSTTIDDLAGLTSDDYRLRFDGASWTLFNDSSGAPVTMTGTGTVADPFVADGLSMVVAGAAVDGDEFLIRPTAPVPGGLAVAIDDPAAIAAAAPTRTVADLDNLGDASISAGETFDASDPLLLTTSTIEFLTPTSYQINGSGSFAYAPGADIDINGTRVVINGTPVAGDQFVIEANTGGIGDNRNALLLADIERRDLLVGGTTDIQDATVNLLGEVAVATRTSEINRDSQEILLQQNIARRESVSGVNLDEEAADLLRFQQAYQAAAQAVSISNSIFQTMLDAFRR